jgi:hypothetical protein
MTLSKAEVTHLQNELNQFVKTHPRLGHQPLLVDGDFGRHTKSLLRNVKYDLGYLRENMNVSVDANFFWRLNHPNAVDPKHGVTKAVMKRAKQRRNRRRRAVAANRFRAFLKPGVGTFDGVTVAKTAIPVLRWCREKGGWKGRLVSGYRTPAYSESLCFRMCGRPQCPGKCAGRATNHAYATPQRFAIDVSDYVNFGHIVARCPVQPHIHNSLPNDLVHFSPSGN